MMSELDLAMSQHLKIFHSLMLSHLKATLRLLGFFTNYENVTICITTWKQQIQWKMLSPVAIEPGPLITSDFKSKTLFS